MTPISNFFDADAAALLERRMAERPRHGDQPRWQAALDALPTLEQGWRFDNGVLRAGAEATEFEALTETLRAFIPWRKGPLNLGGIAIDTEWRSDWKWQRVAAHVALAGKRVLDIGAGNGYFGWKMLAAGARVVIGCDPTALFAAQFRVIEHFAGVEPHILLPLPFEDLPVCADFDQVFSMGVLYHRREPLEHLARIRSHLVPDGELLLETLIIPGTADDELDPGVRYANMRNVYRLPTEPRLHRWLVEAGYTGIETMDITATTTQEQRSTDWMPFHSLARALTPDGSHTVEGHPPPLRAVVRARVDPNASGASLDA
ncbi:MAG: tRNA 5-methoxyuridine(34)/uridine 5-oxyacetic acid(34) synthase CmoB [Wenzhouxiangellaceae bacterium]|nr:tRNA 5-methoxyuridine(34)/uridine 5-oxyacetic acid(34) synthase CmoB [Wenzhouxiangellaceae bacterium]